MEVWPRESQTKNIASKFRDFGCALRIDLHESMYNPLELKPPPPEELSVRAKVHADWNAISKRLERNHNLKIEILQISLRLAAAEATVREGRADPTYDWTADIASARFLHEQMLAWSENNAQYHLYSANYWRDLSKRQWDVAYDYTLSGINGLLLFNGGVALGCLGGLVSERGGDYRVALSFGILGFFPRPASLCCDHCLHDGMAVRPFKADKSQANKSSDIPSFEDSKQICR